MYYLVITGSRTYTHPHIIERAISDALIKAQGEGHELTVVHGDCSKGADALAHFLVTESIAQGVTGLHVEPHPASWKSGDKLAGFARNETMAYWVWSSVAENNHMRKDGSRAFGAAFYHEKGPTNGTRDCHARLKGYGIPTRVYTGTSLIDYDPGTPVRLR